jgi:hypothetical protein
VAFLDVFSTPINLGRNSFVFHGHSALPAAKIIYLMVALGVVLDAFSDVFSINKTALS